jgi:hypothetical protein
VRKRAVLFISLAGLVLAYSCVLPGSATMQLQNRTGKTITHVYYFKTSAGYDAYDRIAGLAGGIANGDNQTFMNIDPGNYTVRVAFDQAGLDFKEQAHTFQASNYVWVTFR